MDPSKGLQAQVVAAIGGLPELRPEAWEGLDTAHRLEALQEAEQLIAAAMGRAACDVRGYDAPPDEWGYFYGPDNAINIAFRLLERDEVAEVVTTFVHEARHAYQSWCINHPGTHPDAAEVEAWMLNMLNYVDPLVDEREYYEQPVEADAWAFEEAVGRGLYGETDG